MSMWIENYHKCKKDYWKKHMHLDLWENEIFKKSCW